MKKNIQFSILALALTVFLISTPNVFASDYINSGNGMAFFTDSASEPKVVTQSSNRVRTDEKEGLPLDHVDAGNGMVYFTDSTPEPVVKKQNSNTQRDVASQDEIVAIDDVAAGHETVFY